MKKIAPLLSTLALSIATAHAADLYKDPKAPVEDRVNDLLPRLTLDEKITMIAGMGDMDAPGIPRLGIPQLKMTDGPVGARVYGKATAYPAGITLAASFNDEQAKRIGEGLGRDCLARGVHILLGPGLNIYRSPLCGRNFEYFGEDPLLSGTIAAAYTQGVQAHNVAATLKHFAGNEQEFDRNNLNSIIDERTLREVYLKPFEIAVKQGGAWCVMDSYNPLNGPHTTADDWLNTQVLKGDWKFPGIVMSDWGAVHETLGVVNGGMDLEMPDPKFLNKKNINPLLTAGTVQPETIDDKVRRRLRMTIAMGWMDHPQLDASIPRDDPDNAKIALQGAREGIVLLKNDGALLPLDKTKIKHIVLLGPNADPAVVCGGGSGATEPFHSVSALAGLKTALPGVEITRIPWTGGTMNEAFYANSKINDAWKTEFFTSTDLTGQPITTRQDTSIDFNWRGSPTEGVPGNAFSLRCTGEITPDKTGPIILSLASDDGSRVFIDGKLVVDNWGNHGVTERRGTLNVVAGKTYKIVVEYYQAGGAAELQFGWSAPQELLSKEDAVLVQNADAAVVCVGFNAKGSPYEGEGTDRTYSLPSGQEELINTVARLNKKTIVVINAGGSVATENWLSKVPGLLMAFYPGQEGGTALAEILTGITNPSARLPITWEKKLEDTPAYTSYPSAATGRVNDYKEGVFNGYRGFDKNNMAPLFPFGFGLSYTTFTMNSIKTQVTADAITAYVEVTNTGKADGMQVVQLYVSPPKGEVDRPIRELKGYAKIEIKAGTTATAHIVIPKESLTYWNPTTKTWTLTPGTYELNAAANSRDIQAKAKVDLK